MRLITLSLLLSFVLPLHAEEKVLNIYNWGDYVGKQTLQNAATAFWVIGWLFEEQLLLAQ